MCSLMSVLLNIATPPFRTHRQRIRQGAVPGFGDSLRRREPAWRMSLRLVRAAAAGLSVAADRRLRGLRFGRRWQQTIARELGDDGRLRGLRRRDIDIAAGVITLAAFGHTAAVERGDLARIDL